MVKPLGFLLSCGLGKVDKHYEEHGLDKVWSYYLVFISGGLVEVAKPSKEQYKLVE